MTALEEKLGYTFTNPALLENALTPQFLCQREQEQRGTEQ